MQINDFTEEQNRNRNRRPLQMEPVINVFLQESKVSSSGNMERMTGELRVKPK